MTMSIERKRGLGIGALFLSFFGAMWLTGGLELAYGKKVLLLDAAIWLVACLIFVVGLGVVRANKLPAGDKKADHGKAFAIINVVQYGAIFLMVQILNATTYGDWVIPGIMLVVGLHFFPMARLFAYRPHLLTGAALVALAMIYPFAGSGPLDPAGCFGAGLILWGTAVFGLVGSTKPALVGKASWRMAPRQAVADRTRK
ncbi:hypothetical protein [Massilia sp. TSP1-1-2]|uniref:hypothetical protein n=1 Tax=Massilia sp. TSP1-1-2 TaxID=2804649 RepID=UPI003CEC9AF5